MRKDKVSLKTYIATFSMIIIIIMIISTGIYYIVWGLSIKEEVERRIKDNLNGYGYFIAILSDKLKAEFSDTVRIVKNIDIKTKFGNVYSGYYHSVNGEFVYIEKFKDGLYKVYYLNPERFLDYIDDKLYPYILMNEKPKDLVYIVVKIYGENYYLAYPEGISFAFSREIMVFQIVQMFAIVAISARFLSQRLRVIVLRPFNEFVNSIDELIKENYSYIPYSESYFKEIDEIRTKLNDFFLKIAEKIENDKKCIDRLNKRIEAMVRIVDMGKDLMLRNDMKKFAKKLIKTVVELVPKADAGSIYLVRGDGSSQFLTSWGYDERYLEGLRLPTYRADAPVVVKWKLTEELIHLPQEIKKLLKLAGSDRINVSLFVPIIIGDSLVGELWIDSFRFDKFDKDEIELANFFSFLAGMFIAHINEREKIQNSIIKTMGYAISEIEFGKPYVEKGHTENVIRHSVGIAKFMGLDRDEIEIVRKSAAVHDVGKALIPASIFLSMNISPEVYEVLKDHVDYTKKILTFLGISEDILRCAYYHHERFDGKGYPEGLSGENIPLCSRILAVADAFDDMTRKKLIGTALSKKEALRKLEQGSGTIWDPKIVRIALKYFAGVGDL